MTRQSPLRLVVLISGNGSNLQAIIDAIANKQLNAEIRVVISNRADAYGLERARLTHIPTEILPNKDYSDRQAYDRALQAIIDRHQPELVLLAGFMRILSAEFVQHYSGRMLNIHPALLPKHTGLHTHEKVLSAKDQYHGATVHFVTEELDGGPIIAHASLEVLAEDSIESLSRRVLALEHKLYPLVVSWYAADRLKLVGQQVELDEKKLPTQGIDIAGIKN